MREIKFRAWDIHNNHGMSEPFGIGQDTIFFDDGRTAHPDFVLHEFLQYTGLKDKNGVEIYEGDVLKHIYKPLGANSFHEWYQYVVVEMCPHKGAAFKVEIKGVITLDSIPERLIGNKFSDLNEHKRVNRKPVFGMTNVIDMSKYEVIGNIYQHPTLLDKR